MAKKLSEFLKALITKAGGNPEDEAIKTALSNINGDLEIDDAVTTSIDNGLLSIAAAKNNHPQLKSHYFGQAYNGLDSEIDRFMQAENLPEEVVSEIKAEQSSTKRAALLAAKIKEIESKKASAEKPDVSKYNTQITELNNQLRAEKENLKKLEQQHSKDLKQFKISTHLKTALGGYKTVYDNLDAESKEIVLTTILKKHLANKEADWDINDKGEFVLAGKDNTNIFSKDNLPLTPKTFIDQVLAEEKMLVVNDNNNGGNNQNNNNSNSYRANNNGQHYNNNGSQGQHNNGQNNNGGRKGNPVLQELIRDASQDIEKSAKGSTRIM